MPARARHEPCICAAARAPTAAAADPGKPVIGHAAALNSSAAAAATTTTAAAVAAALNSAAAAEPAAAAIPRASSHVPLSLSVVSLLAPSTCVSRHAPGKTNETAHRTAPAACAERARPLAAPVSLRGGPYAMPTHRVTHALLDKIHGDRRHTSRHEPFWNCGAVK